jgi:cytochrome c
MRLLVIAGILSVGALLSAPAAHASEAMAKANGCLNCHAVDSKKVGPSFKDIAAKYKSSTGQADVQKELVAKLKGGKGHPATKASDADAMALVQWILAM